MNTVGHQSPGLWTHPRGSDRIAIIRWTIGPTRPTLERGQFDAVFLADLLGIYDVYQGRRAPRWSMRCRCRVNDPSMAASRHGRRDQSPGLWRHLRALSYEHPTVRAAHEHVGSPDTRPDWLEYRHRLSGKCRTRHGPIRANRPRRTLRDCRRLYGCRLQTLGSELGKMARCCATGPPDALPTRTRSTASCMKAATSRLTRSICASRHRNERPCATAGASTRGRQFAAEHAECVFINGPSKKVVGGIVTDIRRRAAAAGRDPRDLIIFTMMTVITDQTREAALEKLRDYQRYVSADGALTLMSGWTGVDFSALPKHEPVRFQAANAMFSALESFTTADPDRAWTVEDQLPAMPASADAGRSLSDRIRISPTSSPTGSAKPMSTASILPMR